jgi:hypothetical protein
MKNYASMTHVSRTVTDKVTTAFNMKEDYNVEVKRLLAIMDIILEKWCFGCT